MNILNLKYKNLYYIGGVVRDNILGAPNFDVDITFEGDAIEFAKNLPNATILKINEDFGTVRVLIDNKEIDIASTRNETYPNKGHLPVVSNIGCSLKEDVLRRDFTINAMAQSTLTGEIIDYTGGLEDIKNKTLRVLHDNSFIDDPTRIVRALKFSIRFGFELDEKTKQLQEKYLENVNYDMSYKRLKKELIETFNLNSQNAFEKFINQKIYKLLTDKDFELPKDNIEELIRKYKPETIWIIYAGLLPDIQKLPLTKLETKIIEDFYSLKDKNYNSAFDIYKNFEGANPESIIMYAVTTNYELATKYLDELRNIKLEISGKDLHNIGITPSSDYQKCFDYILTKKLENPEITKSEEIKLAQAYFHIS